MVEGVRESEATPGMSAVGRYEESVRGVNAPGVSPRRVFQRENRTKNDYKESKMDKKRKGWNERKRGGCLGSEETKREVMHKSSMQLRRERERCRDEGVMRGESER